MKKAIALVSITAVLVGCARAPSNIHALATEDCGATWKKLDTGSSVPKHTGNVCGYNVAIPNWPMAGDAAFKTQFKGQVLTNARWSYTYQITDPLKYIKNAAYLGKMGGSLEISADDVGNKYGMAENILIDKALREVTVSETQVMEIVNANPADIEDKVFSKMKPIMETKGIALTDMALVIEPDQQTRLAIDVATAVRVYENAGIGEIGAQIAVANAGATRVTMNNTPTPVREKD